MDEVDEAVFASFVEALPPADDSAGSQGVGWAKVIRQEKPGAIKVPVVFLELPGEGNQRSLGFDLYSEAIRREAIDIAATTGKPSASGKLQPANRPKSKGLGFLILVPVFDMAAVHPRLSEHLSQTHDQFRRSHPAPDRRFHHCVAPRSPRLDQC